jgi:hypothetical protein
MCQLILTPQLSPHGSGLGIDRCLSLAQAFAFAVRFMNGIRSASEGSNRGCASGSHASASEQPHAHVLQGITESL